MEREKFAKYPSLKDRVVVVTGGATGIGESFVRQFAAQGSRVAFFDIQDEAGRSLAEDVGGQGCPKPDYLHCDLTDVAALKAAVTHVLATHRSIDVLVNNAANDQRHKTEAVTPEYWEQSLAVNLRPQFFMMQAVIPAMKAARRGSIINMSSIS